MLPWETKDHQKEIRQRPTWKNHQLGRTTLLKLPARPGVRQEETLQYFKQKGAFKSKTPRSFATSRADETHWRPLGEGVYARTEREERKSGFPRKAVKGADRRLAPPRPSVKDYFRGGGGGNTRRFNESVSRTLNKRLSESSTMRSKGPSVKNIHLKLDNRDKTDSPKKKKKEFIFGSNISFRVMC